MPTKYSIEDAPSPTAQPAASTKPQYSIEDAPDERPLWQRWKDNFNANTQHVPTTGIKSVLQNIGAGAGDVIRSIPHMLDDQPAETLQQHADRVVAEGQKMVNDPVAAVASQAGQAGTGLLLGEGLGAAARPIGRVASGAVDMISGGTKAAKELNTQAGVDNVEINKANQNATNQFNQKTADATHQTQGRELTHARDVATKAQDIEAQDILDKQKLDQNYQDQLNKTRQHNQQVLNKHKIESGQISQENAGANQTLEMRKKQEADLGKLTSDYYAQEDATKTKAKADENAAWAPWRQKMQNVTIDGSEITQPLEKIAATSPEVTRTLNQLQPPPEDAPADSAYAQDRAAIMKSLGYTGSYFDYPENARSTIDKIAASSGFEPDPIDFNPQPGRPIPVDQVHRANSILQGYIRSGRFEGPILGEMKQVAKTLRATVSRASAANGALEDLNAARDASIKYQDAFGRERHLPSTQDEIREKQANPEAFKERNDEERLQKAANYDPSLVESFRKVKSARESLKQLPAEDQLRKSLKQVPASPTVGDVRPGYSLLPEPQAPQARLTSGSPVERAAQQVPLPERVGLPAPPELTPNKTIGPEDIKAAKIKNIHGLADWIQSHGRKAAMSTAITAPSGAVIGSVFGHGLEGAGLGSAMSAGVWGTSELAAAALRNPGIIKLLSKVTPSEAAAITPEIARNLQPIIEAAKQQGIKISPAITAAVSAHSSKDKWWDQPK